MSRQFRPLNPFADAWFSKRRVAPQLQAESAECGLACLAMIATYHGYKTDVSELRARFGSSSRGVTLANMISVAGELRFTTRPLRLSLDNLTKLSLPAILHWNLDHFVVLCSASARSVRIIDPAVGERTLSMADCSKHFTGIALEIRPSPDFTVKPAPQRLGLRDFLSSSPGLLRALGILLVFSLALQSFALTVPLLTQLALDHAIVNGDDDLLVVLALAFTAMGVLQVGLGFVRTLGVLHLGAHLKFTWGARLFHHLLRLPLEFFERRHVGDILSKFNSLGTIQSLVTTTLVEALLDGLLATTTLAVMLLYSVKLTLISVTTIAVLVVVRSIVLPFHRSATHEAILDAAKEDTYLLESLRGMLTIKSFGLESLRESAWQGRAADEIRSGVASNLYPSTERSIGQLLLALENVAIICVGATLVMSSELTVGMLVAFIAYKAQFTSRAGGLIDRTIEIRLASLHSERISDIAFAEEEFPGSALEHISPMTVHGAIEVQNVSFQYGTTDPLVLDDLSLRIDRGECVVLVAPSGLGKTTLLKLMMGLVRPSKGKIVVDGRELTRDNIRQFRTQIAAVMQEDTLLSGSIAENIAAFAPSPDMERVQRAARLASIDDVIRAFPMGYSTQVGDMGSALSGGQRQRILLARALYRDPRILFLDEATAHLDVMAEADIHRSLAGLGITRVVISHRPSTAEIADRVIDIRSIQRLGPMHQVAESREKRAETVESTCST